MTLLHIHSRGLWTRFVDRLAHSDENGPMHFGMRVGINPAAHQIRLTLSWRAAATGATVLFGLILSAVLMGMDDRRQLLLSTLSTEQVQAMPVSATALDVEPELPAEGL